MQVSILLDLPSFGLTLPVAILTETESGLANPCRKCCQPAYRVCDDDHDLSRIELLSLISFGD